MFEKLKKASLTNKIWSIILSDQYLGKMVLNDTLIKIDSLSLIVTTSNPTIKKILTDNKFSILNEIKVKLDTNLLDIVFV